MSKSISCSAGPDASGEGFDGVEAEFFVELDGGAVFGRHGKSQFPEFHGAESFGGSLHEHAAETVSLIARQDADLRGVADAGRNLAGEDSGDEFVAAGLVEDEGCARHELAAAGEQDDVLQEFQGPGAAAVLVVDLAIDVIRVGQIDQFGARLEITVVPTRETHAVGGARLGLRHFLEVEERGVHRAAERHELSFDARQVRNRTHGEEHLFKEAPADGSLREFGRNVEATDQAFLLLEDIEGIAGGRAIFKGHTSGERVGVEEALDEFERAAVVPMELVAPVPGLLFEKRLNLADGSLSQVNDVHGWAESGAAPALPFLSYPIRAGPRLKGRAQGDTSPTQRKGFTRWEVGDVLGFQTLCLCCEE